MTTYVHENFEISADELHDQSRELLSRGFRLASVVANDDGDAIRIVYLFTCGPPDQRQELVVHLNADAPSVPTLSDLSFPASRFEREIHDMFGVVPIGHPFLRPLVLHQHWPEGWYPMRHNVGPMPPMREDAANFPFVEVQGAGVYEIPVGPVHAGLIEPGHFRFSVVGETILKMKARLWFVHRGIEQLFEGRGVDQGVELAERVSGDTAVGHTLAYCMAIEEAQGITLPEPATRSQSGSDGSPTLTGVAAPGCHECPSTPHVERNRANRRAVRGISRPGHVQHRRGRPL